MKRLATPAQSAFESHYTAVLEIYAMVTTKTILINIIVILMMTILGVTFFLKIFFLICLLCRTEELLELHRGQGMDIYWRDSYSCPTEDEYKEMVQRSKCLYYLTALRTSFKSTCKAQNDYKYHAVFELQRTG